MKYGVQRERAWMEHLVVGVIPQSRSRVLRDIWRLPCRVDDITDCWMDTPRAS